MATNLTATVSTTSDPGAIASSGFTTTTRQALSGVTVGLSNTAAASNSTYVIGFTLSASGTLAGSANSRIDITFPAGTTFASLTGNATVVDTTTGQDVGNCFSPSGLVIQCYLDTAATIPSGRTVRISFTGITNPAATGEKQLTVVTTSDTQATGNYQIGQAEPLDTTLLTGPAGPTNDTTPTFTFTGNGTGFECRVDAGAVRRLHVAVHHPRADARRPHVRGAVDHRRRARSDARDADVRDRHDAARRAGRRLGTGRRDDRHGAGVRVHRGRRRRSAGSTTRPSRRARRRTRHPRWPPEPHVFEVRARDAAGNVATSSRAFTVTVPQQQTPTPDAERRHRRPAAPSRRRCPTERRG